MKNLKIIKNITAGVLTFISLTGIANAEINQIEAGEFEMNTPAYYEYLQNVNMDEYDEEFVDFYRTGYILYNGESYLVSDLFIVNGTLNDNEEIYLINCHNNKYNLLDNTIMSQDYKRNKIMQFNLSQCFYDMYSELKDYIQNGTLVINEENINQFLSIVNTYNGEKHTNTPEQNYQKSITKR